MSKQRKHYETAFKLEVARMVEVDASLDRALGMVENEVKLIASSPVKKDA